MEQQEDKRHKVKEGWLIIQTGEYFTLHYTGSKTPKILLFLETGPVEINLERAASCSHAWLLARSPVVLAARVCAGRGGGGLRGVSGGGLRCQAGLLLVWLPGLPGAVSLKWCTDLVLNVRLLICPACLLSGKLSSGWPGMDWGELGMRYLCSQQAGNAYLSEPNIKILVGGLDYNFVYTKLFKQVN